MRVIDPALPASKFVRDINKALLVAPQYIECLFGGIDVNRFRLHSILRHDDRERDVTMLGGGDLLEGVCSPWAR